MDVEEDGIPLETSPGLMAAFEGEAGGVAKELFSLILLKAEGEGKLVSLLMLFVELSLQMDLAELKPLELEVLFPKPASLGVYWYRIWELWVGGGRP